MKTILLVATFCISTIYIHAQGFHFGANLSGVSSQIEGDKLRGFHHFGYSFGLIGGYTFTEAHYLVVSPQYSYFGSKRKNERPGNETKQIFVEMDLSTINVLFGYSYRFGDSWTEEKKYRINAGVRVHRLLNAQTNIIRTGQIEAVTIDQKADLTNFFSTLELGVGLNLTRHLGLELSYDHSLQNILKNKKANLTKLAPFYLSLGVSYYFF